MGTTLERKPSAPAEVDKYMKALEHVVKQQIKVLDQ